MNYKKSNTTWFYKFISETAERNLNTNVNFFSAFLLALIIMSSGLVFYFLTSHYSLGFSGEAKIISANQLIVSLNPDELKQLKAQPNASLLLEIDQVNQISPWAISSEQVINSQHVLTIDFKSSLIDASTTKARYRFILEDIVYWKLLL